MWAMLEGEKGFMYRQMSSTKRTAEGVSTLAWDACAPVVNSTVMEEGREPRTARIVNFTWQCGLEGTQRVGGVCVPTETWECVKPAHLVLSLLFSPSIGAIDNNPYKTEDLKKIYGRARSNFEMHVLVTRRI